MVLGQWAALTAPEGEPLSPELPVLFYHGGGRPLPPESYCTGGGVQVSCYWDGARGWRPCVLVELGEPF